MKKLWKFYWDSCYGNICGMFKATDKEIENLIGKEIYLGEIEGKHSEVYGKVEKDEITLVSDDPKVVDAVEPIGINPLQHLPECFE